jgi:hypothetical protein
LTARKKLRTSGEAGVVELTSYGLTGLTALLAIILCFAYKEQLSLTRQKSSYGLIYNAYLNDSPMIEIAPRSPRFEETVGNEQSITRSYLMRPTSPLQTRFGAVYGRSLQSDQGQVEDFHA